MQTRVSYEYLFSFRPNFLNEKFIQLSDGYS